MKFGELDIMFWRYGSFHWVLLPASGDIPWIFRSNIWLQHCCLAPGCTCGNSLALDCLVTVGIEAVEASDILISDWDGLVLRGDSLEEHLLISFAAVLPDLRIHVWTWLRAPSIKYSYCPGFDDRVLIGVAQWSFLPENHLQLEEGLVFSVTGAAVTGFLFVWMYRIAHAGEGV